MKRKLSDVPKVTQLPDKIRVQINGSDQTSRALAFNHNTNLNSQRILTYDFSSIWSLKAALWLAEVAHEGLSRGWQGDCHVAFPITCLSILTTWWLASPDVSNPREAKAEAGMTRMTWPHPSHNVTSTVFYRSHSTAMTHREGRRGGCKYRAARTTDPEARRLSSSSAG